MKKMKEFYQKHKEDITNFAWMMAGAAVGICTVSAMYRKGVLVTHDGLKEILVDAHKEFGDGNVTIFTANYADGLNASKLGELGDSITKCGAQDNIFKYFVAIGPYKASKK